MHPPFISEHEARMSNPDTGNSANGDSFDAHFFDGNTARRHDVSITIGPEGINLTPRPGALHGSAVKADNIQPQFWPAADLELLSITGRRRSPDILRLGNRAIPDARLILDYRAAAVFLQTFPHLRKADTEIRNFWPLVIALTSASAALLFLVFVALPAASGLMARSTPREFEKKLGDNYASQIALIMRTCKNSDAAVAMLTPVVNEMARKGAVGTSIHIRFAQVDLPNAFALPGGHVIITQGLLASLDDQEAFLAVLAHEMGHVKARDGLQGLYRNFSLGILLDLITGGSGIGTQAVGVASQLTTLRLTRQQEARADSIGGDILVANNLDPAALADAFKRIETTMTKPRGTTPKTDANNTKASSEPGSDSNSGRHLRIPTWLSSHPETAQRIRLAEKRARPSGPPPLSPQSWQVIRGACG